MKITKIEFQKKNKSRANLYVDNKFCCGLALETVLKNRLKENQDIYETKIDNLKNLSEKQVCLNNAIKFISKYQKTKKEIENYLLKKGFDKEIIVNTILKLKEYNFIDDERYAGNFIKFKSKTSGSKKLEFELKQKGIDEKLAHQKICELNNDKDNIINVMQKYLNNKPRDLKTKQKTYRFLVSRGFSYDLISQNLNKIFKEVESDECRD